MTFSSQSQMRHFVVFLFDPVFRVPSINAKPLHRKFGKALAAFGSSSFLGVLMSDPGPWTIFVPSEEAFGTLSDEELRDFLSNTPQLDKTLMRHAVRGSIFRRRFTW